MTDSASSKYVDLHVHTTCSDGTLTPEEVVEKAYKENIGVVAITDHDNVSGIFRAKEAAKKYGINVISGIECSTECKTGTLHILGYYIDPNNENINNFIKECQKNRIERINKIINKLENLGFDITFDEVKKVSNNGSIGRPHIARVMFEKGYISSVKECFEKYIGRGMPAYVPKINPSLEEVLYAIKSSGGIAILAHPLQMKCGTIEDTIREVERLVKLGIEGVESIYPAHDMSENTIFSTFTKTKNIYITCGSDFHGENKTIQLGNCYYNEKKISLEELESIGKTFL